MSDKLNNIKEQVEQRLQEAQSSKEFKDVGRVAMTKKELSAYKIINSDTLEDLEKDAVLAHSRVKKDAVWQPIDVSQEKESGTSSGCAFMKVKIRESLPAKPKDSSFSRALYVQVCDYLQDKLAFIKSTRELKDFCEKLLRGSEEQLLSLVIPNYHKKDEQTRVEIINRFKSEYKVASFYGTQRLVESAVKKEIGSRFYNLIMNYSDASKDLWRDAFSKDAISKEESQILIDKIKDRKTRFIEANKQKIEDYKFYNKMELLQKMDREWSIPAYNKSEYKKEPELFRAFVVRYLNNKIEKEESVFERLISEAKPKDNDWSWFEDKTTKTKEVSKPKAQAINTKRPLSYIKRTGGLKIDTVTPQEIVDRFGFSAVNYGNYVDDRWSKDHTEHFLGAISDLGEILNFDIRQVNKLGRLGIAFGAKGRKGHLATYFPSTKDINLTKGNGDGSVAHEWGHYFDNVLKEMDVRRGTSSFYSETYNDGSLIGDAFKEFMNFIYKGKEGVTPRVPFRFFPKKQDSAPFIYFRSGKVSVEILDTIEDTIARLENICVLDKDYHSTQNRVFGYIIDQFGLDYYDVPLKLKTSYFLHKSAYNTFCWNYQIDGKYQIYVEPRTKYWTSAVELFARAFETIVLYKLVNKNRMSNYLVDDIPTEDLIFEGYQSPYPSGAEVEYLSGLLDGIIQAAKKQYLIGSFNASGVREDEYHEISDSKNKNGVKTIKKEDTETTVFTDNDKVVSVSIESTQNQELKDAISGLEMMLQVSFGSDRQELEDAISGLKLMLNA